MAAYVIIPDATLQPGQFITSAQGFAFRDNLTAVAEGDATTYPTAKGGSRTDGNDLRIRATALNDASASPSFGQSLVTDGIGNVILSDGAALEIMTSQTIDLSVSFPNLPALAAIRIRAVGGGGAGIIGSANAGQGGGAAAELDTTLRIPNDAKIDIVIGSGAVYGGAGAGSTMITVKRADQPATVPPAPLILYQFVCTGAITTGGTLYYRPYDALDVGGVLQASDRGVDGMDGGFPSNPGQRGGNGAGSSFGQGGFGGLSEASIPEGTGGDGGLGAGGGGGYDGSGSTDFPGGSGGNGIALISAS